MPEEHDVKITQWPKEKATLEHHFQLEEPCPVAIVFDEKPAMVEVTANPERPVHMKMDMDMDMNVKAREPFPVCIRICEPICAVSDYQVGINLLGQPLLQIAVSGTTKLGDCKEETHRTTCVDFVGRKTKEVIAPPLNVGIISITPLSGEGNLTTTYLLPPPEKIQLLIPERGLRLKFAAPVTNVRMKVANGGNPVLEVAATYQGIIGHTAVESVSITPREVFVPGDAIDMVTIRGGSNEAVIIEICYDHSGQTSQPELPPEVTLL